MKALELIAAERERQITEEGWTRVHDNEHVGEELAAAAACYALPKAMRQVWARDVPTQWPWDARFWKPKDRITDLVRAGALIVAEIERLQYFNSARLAKSRALMTDHNDPDDSPDHRPA